MGRTTALHRTVRSLIMPPESSTHHLHLPTYLPAQIDPHHTSLHNVHEYLLGHTHTRALLTRIFSTLECRRPMELSFQESILREDLTRRKWMAAWSGTFKEHLQKAAVVRHYPCSRRRSHSLRST